MSQNELNCTHHYSAHPSDNVNMKITIIHTDAILQLSEVSAIGNKSLKIILDQSLKPESSY